MPLCTKRSRMRPGLRRRARPPFLTATVLVLSAAALAPPAAEAQEAGLPDSTRLRIDSLFVKHAKASSPGCAVGVVHDGGLAYAQGYGMSSLEHDVPITPSTVFHAASVAKQFTAFVVAQLAAEGRLSLDDDIRTHLPEMHDFGTPITLRHLLTHTSGLRDQWVLLRLAGWRADDPKSQEDILGLAFAQRELNFSPGTEWTYSNTGYTLLAEVARRVTGSPFPVLAEERVFRPLGMSRTLFLDDHDRVVPGRASAYEPALGGGWRTSEPVFDNVGATSLLTTVEDLGRWAENLWARRVAPEAVDLMLRTRGVLANGDTLSYGLGLAFGRQGGMAAVGHSGGDAGFVANLLVFPEERFASATLCNASTAPAYDIDPAVARIVLADRWRDPPERPRAPRPQPTAAEARPLTPAELRALAGTYRSEELDVAWRIGVRGGDLVLHRRRFPDVVLERRPGGEFAWDGYRLRFVREGRRVTGLRVSSGRARNLRFDRVR